jgi:hypothetical protein
MSFPAEYAGERKLPNAIIAADEIANDKLLIFMIYNLPRFVY